MSKKKDPYEGTLQYGLPENIVFLLKSAVEDMRKDVLSLRNASDQSLLDLATISYKLGYEIAKTMALSRIRAMLDITQQ